MLLTLKGMQVMDFHDLFYLTEVSVYGDYTHRISENRARLLTHQCILNMLVTNSKSLKEIQKEFNDKFPYLKLEFYKQPHGNGEGSEEQQHVLDVEKTIGEVRRSGKSGELSFNANQKVNTLEQGFYEEFGINVQVFRRSGEVWLQTTTTDNWTLAEQNERGLSETEFYFETHGIKGSIVQ